MGAIFALILSGLCVVGLYHFATDKSTRAAAFAKLRVKPIETFLLAVWVASALGFFWGIIFDISFYIPLPWGHIRFWQLAGVLSLVGTVIFFSSGKRFS